MEVTTVSAFFQRYSWDSVTQKGRQNMAAELISGFPLGNSRNINGTPSPRKYLGPQGPSNLFICVHQCWPCEEGSVWGTIQSNCKVVKMMFSLRSPVTTRSQQNHHSSRMDVNSNNCVFQLAYLKGRKVFEFHHVTTTRQPHLWNDLQLSGLLAPNEFT